MLSAVASLLYPVTFSFYVIADVSGRCAVTFYYRHQSQTVLHV